MEGKWGYVKRGHDYCLNECNEEGRANITV